MPCCDSNINPTLKLGPNRWQSREEISNVCALQKPNHSKLRAEAAVGLQPHPCKGTYVRKGQKRHSTSSGGWAAFPELTMAQGQSKDQDTV